MKKSFLIVINNNQIEVIRQVEEKDRILELWARIHGTFGNIQMTELEESRIERSQSYTNNGITVCIAEVPVSNTTNESPSYKL